MLAFLLTLKITLLLQLNPMHFCMSFGTVVFAMWSTLPTIPHAHNGLKELLLFILLPMAVSTVVQRVQVSYNGHFALVHEYY